MIKLFRYKSIFLYASLQFCGHIEEYFSKHSEKCVVFIISPRVQGVNNILRVYHQGKLRSEKDIRSSKNIFLYYFFWLLHHWKILLTEFNHNEKFVVISGHPITFFGMTGQKRMRQAKFAYWVGDYFPSVNLSLMLYEKLKLFYHHYADYRYYLSDRINEKFNYGKAVQTLSSRTVMWGVKPTALEKKSRSAIHLLSVGLIKESQGLVYLMDFLKDHSEFTLSIIGFCEPELYMKFMDLVRENILASRVFFPNKFYSERELIRYSKRCHIGIALYDEGNMTATYYTDPGKIKSYLEMGLPIIMTRTSAIEKYVKQFNCGEVVERNNNALSEAVQKIIRQYSQYVSGVEKINDFFNFETYYKNSFSILESYES